MISLSSTGNSAPADETAGAESISPKRLIRIYRVLLTLVTFLVSLAIAEGVLRLVEKSQLGDRAIQDKLINDPILGLKLPPHTLGHDANGFRNDSVSQQADVVVLGDSQTWGVNAERKDAWPQQLSKLSGLSAYNMGMGGFGPVQYKAVLPQALRLSPKIIVVGFYFGNDIYDAYHMAYQYEAHRDLPTYQKLVKMEGRVRSEILSTCEKNGIPAIDALPYLSSALDRGERIYPSTTESHPNAHGYLVIASAVNENISKLD